MINFIKTVYPDVVGGPITKVPVTIAQGTTMYIRTESEQIMSDIWEMVTKAFYWDAASGAVREKWLDNDTKVTIDADFDSLLPAIESAEYAKFLKVELENTKAESENPAVRGRMVEVVRGRDKTVKGKTGKVVVVKDMQYGMGYRSVVQPKLGIALNDEMVEVVRNGKTYTNYKNMIWVWAHNCEVVAPETDVFYAEKCAKARTESYIKALKDQIARSIKTFN